MQHAARNAISRVEMEDDLIMMMDRRKAGHFWKWAYSVMAEMTQ
jgi:hypothetical protein